MKAFEATLILGFFLLLAFSGSREVLLLQVRMLFPLQGDIIAQGQIPSCEVMTIPNSVFSPAYEAQLESRSGDSPDIFAMARRTKLDEMALPPVEMWRAHPLQRWAAFHLASTLYAERHAPDFRDRAANVMAYARIVLNEAREAEPANGALALAAASVHFSWDEDEEAIVALKDAVQLGNWHLGNTEAMLHRKRLFEQLGLTELDAQFATMGRPLDMYARIVSQNIVDGLKRKMTIAVDAGDKDEFLSLFHLLKSLQAQRWSDHGMWNEIKHVHMDLWLPDEQLIPAIMRSLNRPIPDRSLGFRQTDRIQTEAAHDFLIQFARVPEAEASFSGSPDHALKAHSDHMCNAGWRARLLAHFWASVWGSMGLITLCFVIACLLGQALLQCVGRVAGWPRGKRIAAAVLMFATAAVVGIILLEGPVRGVTQQAGMGQVRLTYQPYVDAFALSTYVFMLAWLGSLNSIPQSIALAFRILANWRVNVTLWLLTLPLSAWYRSQLCRLILQDDFGV
jgi:hypothetical protein